MNLGFLTKGLRLSSRKFAAVALLNLGTLAWFFLLVLNMTDIFAALTPNDPDWGLYVGQILVYGFAIFFSITIGFIAGKINRRKLLFTSIFLGVFSTILLGLSEGTVSASISSCLIGMSLGLGLPSSMALVADYTAVENRGRVSGAIIFGTFVMAFAAIALKELLVLNIIGTVLLFAIVRSISFLALAMDKCDRQLPTVKEKTHMPSAAYREFLFYLCPWVMFTIASGLALNLISPTDFPSEIYSGNLMRFVFLAVFGLAAGFVADRFGRKPPIYIGLAVLGIGSLNLGFNLSGTSVLIYLALSGIAWGTFFVVFLAVPGDLSVLTSREKFYALGYILPLAGMFAISAIPAPTIQGILPSSLISQILGIFLFLAIIPVSRAKETLLESKIQERRMKEYVEIVGKEIQRSEKEK